MITTMLSHDQMEVSLLIGHGSTLLSTQLVKQAQNRFYHYHSCRHQLPKMEISLVPRKIGMSGRLWFKKLLNTTAVKINAISQVSFMKCGTSRILHNLVNGLSPTILRSIDMQVLAPITQQASIDFSWEDPEPQDYTKIGFSHSSKAATEWIFFRGTHIWKIPLGLIKTSATLFHGSFLTQTLPLYQNSLLNSDLLAEKTNGMGQPMQLLTQRLLSDS
ncbi:MAG: hypothetical protein ACD_36C00106G0002 [uncultured bacterium]|nr:MAG: hypothetical protein ACD_36C00106G0002 [uncultured bacterium]